MPPEDNARIVHMIEAAQSAVKFCHGRKRSDLDNDEMLLFAIVRAIEIIGEAASKVSLQRRASIPAVPWPSIISMRNRLAHAYFDINCGIVWETATVEVPELLALLLPHAPKELG